jgi:hypothetical protein
MMRTLNPDKGERFIVSSMGKRFYIRAIATTDDEANRYCETHPDTGVIATFAPFVFIANIYEVV